MVYYVYCIVAIGTNVKERNKTNLLAFESDKARGEILKVKCTIIICCCFFYIKFIFDGKKYTCDFIAFCLYQSRPFSFLVGAYDISMQAIRPRPRVHMYPH